uniref:Ovule protein n=1 Tax=Bursaphelenchus xylophilus TaxID=6326 RepID=A0A1I7SKF7_BURXY
MENLQFERRAQYNYKFSSERSEPTVTRIWRPNVTDLTNNQVRNRVQNANERNVKVSLEHQKL